MKLSQLGEFGLIERIAARESKLSSTVVGIGDDCAVLRAQNSKLTLTLITTDTLVENVDFKRKGLSFFHLGRKALLANISDISAMGGAPTHALVTIGLPKTMDVGTIDELYRGIDSLAKKHKIDIVGGDTTDSAVIFISITLLGEVEKENLLLRSRAKVGDLICVTGYFGGPAAGKYDSRKQKVPRLRSGQAESRTQEARNIAKSRTVTAMIDSSDGLVRSIMEICRASKVGARIFQDKVPIAKGATLEQALYGGEEYELVFTMSKNKLKGLKGVKFTVVGEVVSCKAGVRLVDGRGKMRELKSSGYEHFK